MPDIGAHKRSAISTLMPRPAREMRDRPYLVRACLRGPSQGARRAAGCVVGLAEVIALRALRAFVIASCFALIACGSLFHCGKAEEPRRHAHGRSQGCGKPGAAGRHDETRRVDATERTFHVWVPEAYDPQRAYPLIFKWHGTGGDGLSGGLDIQDVARDAAIVVAADGLNRGFSPRHWLNDLELFDTMLRELTERYCVDEGRVFSYGFSAGGGVTNALSCVRSEQLRGIAAVAAFHVPLPSCDGPMAAWLRHDRDDPAVAILHGRKTRDQMRRRNGCSDRTERVNDECVRYRDCAPGYPLVYCESRGRGHFIAADSAPQSVWRFFSSLPAVP